MVVRAGQHDGPSSGSLLTQRSWAQISSSCPAAAELLGSTGAQTEGLKMPPEPTGKRKDPVIKLLLQQFLCHHVSDRPQLWQQRVTGFCARAFRSKQHPARWSRQPLLGGSAHPSDTALAPGAGWRPACAPLLLCNICGCLHSILPRVLRETGLFCRKGVN